MEILFVIWIIYAFGNQVNTVRDVVSVSRWCSAVFTVRMFF
jgi:hypothetical protein